MTVPCLTTHRSPPILIHSPSRGPYPSVWAMLALYLHPDNARTPPQVLTSYQTLYPRSNVDLNSRWLLEFPGLGGVQALLTTDMDTMGCGDMTALISCEHADLAIACECRSVAAAYFYFFSRVVSLETAGTWLASACQCQVPAASASASIPVALMR